MRLTISEIEKTALLDALWDTPPTSSKDECDTQDRQLLWMDLRYETLILRLSLNAFFQGFPDPLVNQIEASFWSQTPSGLVRTDYTRNNWQEFFARIESLQDYYLAAYALIQRGWRFLLPHWEERFEKPIPEKPGDLLIAIIRSEYMERLYQLFPEKVTGNYWAEISPRKQYQQFLKAKKLPQEIEEIVKSGKTLKEGHRYYFKELERAWNERYPFVAYRWFVEEYSERYKSEDSILKKRLKGYYKAQSTFFKSERAWWKSSKGIQVKRGNITQVS